MTLKETLDHSAQKHGDKILIMGGIPTRRAKGTNFLKIHTVGGANNGESE